jgi:cytochrome c biogenesis protein CcdA/thiol-disulfide isomerase/thioredoxin
MTLILLALVVGAVSVLTPCILPLLPTILAFSTGEGRRRVWGIVIGIEISFIGISLLLTGVLQALGLPPRSQEILAAVIIGLFGITLLVPPLERKFQEVTSSLVSRLPQRQAKEGEGFGGGLLGGLSLGLVWAPCAGPLLASVTAAANTHGFTTQTIFVTLAYGVGMFFPLLAVAIGGRTLGMKLRRLTGGGSRVLAPMGVLLLATAVLIGSGQLTVITKQIADKVKLTSTPTAAIERKALDKTNGKSNVQGGTTAPAFAGISKWYNTADGKPLTIAGLKGKVVLVDFWTYSCINCLRTLPYLQAWHDKYEKDGLVIVGVHTPEFAFEKDTNNVGKAIKRLDVTWPVALDPDYKTWNNYDNRAWPAEYLINKAGKVVSTKEGEGDYTGTEQEIRTELGLDTKTEGDLAASSTKAMAAPVYATTPELYVGYDRRGFNDRTQLVGGGSIVKDKVADYQPPSQTAANFGLAADEYTLIGKWKVEGSRATAAGPDSRIVLRYTGEDVFMVAGAENGTGELRPTFDSGTADQAVIPVTDQQLYTLRTGDTDQTGLVDTAVKQGTSVYTYTFG